MDHPQSHVSHFVVNTGNGEGGKGGYFVNVDPHSQSTSVMTSNRRLGGTEFDGPADGWGVVTPHCHVDMLQHCITETHIVGVMLNEFVTV